MQHPPNWVKSNHFWVISSSGTEVCYTWIWADLSNGHQNYVGVFENWWLCTEIRYIGCHILLATTRTLLIMQTWLLEYSYCSMWPTSWCNNFWIFWVWRLSGNRSARKSIVHSSARDAVKHSKMVYLLGKFHSRARNPRLDIVYWSL